MVVKKKMANIASNKTKITITLDTDIYLRIKTNPQLNASALVNNFFKGYFDYQEQSKEDKDVDTLEAEAEELNKKSMILKAKAINLRAELQKKYEEEIDKAKRFSKGMKDSGVLDFD